MFVFYLLYKRKVIFFYKILKKHIEDFNCIINCINNPSKYKIKFAYYIDKCNKYRFLFSISTFINELDDNKAQTVSIMITAFIPIKLIKASYKKEVLS